MAAKLVDLGDPRVERRYAVFGGSKFFARNVGAGAEFFTAFNPVLLQIQQRFRHLLDVENLGPALVAAAFAFREFALDVYEQACTPTFAAR